MKGLDVIRSDVLVLGAGFAGLRAAWAAKAASPRLDVTVVSLRYGPSGSSFANINDRLGMQVCMTDGEQADFIRDVFSIAAPGTVNRDLVAIMAAESEARLRDLSQAGLSFNRDDTGQYSRVPGCFSPQSPRAVVLTGLNAAFTCLKNKFLSLGGRFMDGWMVQDLLHASPLDSGGVHGVLLRHAKGRDRRLVQAKSVVFALGGPASLFELNIAGPGISGFSLAMLRRAGVELINVGYLQFLWHTLPTQQFWPIANLALEGHLYRGMDKIQRALPDHLKPYAAHRATHCPVAHGLADEEMDHHLIGQLDDRGGVAVFDPRTGWCDVALMAHAGNGGAKIDMDGWTGIPGLYACGECAGGMHGANRVGGAMILATQVFGVRAGKAAADYARQTEFCRKSDVESLGGLISQCQREDEDQWRGGIAWVRQGMGKHAIPGRQLDLKDFMGKCKDRLEESMDWRLRIALESALIVCRGQLNRRQGIGQGSITDEI